MRGKDLAVNNRKSPGIATAQTLVGAATSSHANKPAAWSLSPRRLGNVGREPLEILSRCRLGPRIASSSAIGVIGGSNVNPGPSFQAGPRSAARDFDQPAHMQIELLYRSCPTSMVAGPTDWFLRRPSSSVSAPVRNQRPSAPTGPRQHPEHPKLPRHHRLPRQP
jgi:hypothetical protein